MYEYSQLPSNWLLTWHVCVLESVRFLYFIVNELNVSVEIVYDI
ncbi:hypothetical protein [Ehrlichia ruminantium]|nr:hypothetical protein [Ehrlichia ruminantium]